MGNQPSVKTSNSKNQYFRHFERTRKNGEELLVCQKAVLHPKIRQKWESLVIELRNIPNQHIMVPKNWTIAEHSLCGNGEILEIDYENYSANLSELIQDRSVSGKHFEESQIWYVLYALSQVGINCRSLGHKVGDIRPENILMNNEGQIKILTFLSFPNDINTFADQSSQIFFSPQQLEQRKKGYMQSLVQPVRSQSFAIGLTILSMALLQKVGNIFNYKSNELNENLLNSYIDNMKGISYHSTLLQKTVPYSQSLIDAVKLLLAISPQKRLGYTHLYRQLQPFLQKIEEFQHFDIKLTVPEETQSRIKGKDVITLRSRHKKQRNQSTPQSEVKTISNKKIPSYETSYIESRYMNLSNEPLQKGIVFGNPSLLDSIDQKLKKSRQQFPS